MSDSPSPPDRRHRTVIVVPLELGSYRLVELLSSSAVASVYRATDPRHHNRVVAVKIFAWDLAADPAFRTRSAGTRQR